MFKLVKNISKKIYLQKIMFLTTLFGLMIVVTQDVSASRSLAAATETKTTIRYTTGTSTNADTDLMALARKYIPNGAEIIHKVVQGKFAASAANVVVMYRDKSDPRFGKYNTVVLVPKGASWEKYVLPQPGVNWSFMKPMAVFFENVDGDGENELLILEQAESGAGPTGAQPFYRTRVYDWSGSRFVHREEISDKISPDADTAEKVRRELRRITMNAQTNRSPNNVVTHNSFGKIKVGMTVSQASQAFGAELVAPFGKDGCHYVQPKQGFKGVSFMVIDGVIARIEIESKAYATDKGAKIGDTEAKIKSLYKGVTVNPQKYDEKKHDLEVYSEDKKYLIIFETDGKVVTGFRAGRAEEVGWVERCG